MNIWRRFSTDDAERPGEAVKGMVWMLAFLACAVVLGVLSVCFGAVWIPPQELAGVFRSADPSSPAYRIVMFVRLPRTAAAMLSGGALAVSGAIIQAVLNNALAGPNIIGVNAGAGLFALLCMVLFPTLPGLLPAAAFCGALLAALVVYAIAVKTGASRVTIVLTGVAVGSILSAGISAVTILYPDAVIGASSFMVGGLGHVTIGGIRFAAGYIGAGLLLALLLGYEMNLLTLGEDTALSLGMRVGVYRFVLIMTAAMLAGAAVSFAGLLGFVGLIVPHGVRILAGGDHRFLIPCCALCGAAFVTACDLLARLVFSPYELPVGIVMSFLGGPFFIWLLFKQRRRLHD
jgi:iron complex transport system permease protein